MKVFDFSLKLKERPEDFIVKEIADFEKGRNHFLYLLIKRDFNLFDIKLDFSFAGIKDKKALTFQYVSFERFLGKKIEIEDFKNRLREKKPWYYFKFLGRIKKKIRPGFLKGNKFFIRTETDKLEVKDSFINYYDIQRLKDNWKDGLILINTIKETKNPIKKIKIDALLSYLWNKSLEEYLKEKFNGYYLKDQEFLFFIPEDFEELNIKFWPILGYKTIEKLSDKEREFYEKVLEDLELNIDKLGESLKKLKLKGDYRKIIAYPREIKILNNYLSFFLPKGSYATMYLKFCYKI